MMELPRLMYELILKKYIYDSQKRHNVILLTAIPNCVINSVTNDCERVVYLLWSTLIVSVGL